MDYDQWNYESIILCFSFRFSSTPPLILHYLNPIQLWSLPELQPVCLSAKKWSSAKEVPTETVSLTGPKINWSLRMNFWGFGLFITRRRVNSIASRDICLRLAAALSRIFVSRFAQFLIPLKVNISRTKTCFLKVKHTPCCKLSYVSKNWGVFWKITLTLKETYDDSTSTENFYMKWIFSQDEVP